MNFEVTCGFLVLRLLPSASNFFLWSFSIIFFSVPSKLLLSPFHFTSLFPVPYQIILTSFQITTHSLLSSLIASKCMSGTFQFLPSFFPIAFNRCPVPFLIHSEFLSSSQSLPISFKLSFHSFGIWHL